MEQDDQSTDGGAALQEDSSSLRLSMRQVHRINARRMKYIGLYLLWFAAQAYAFFFMNGWPGFLIAIPSFAVLFVFFVLFYSVLRDMAYPALLIMAIFFMALFPIPGLLIVVMVDRSISKVLRKGIENAEAAIAARSGESE